MPLDAISFINYISLECQRQFFHLIEQLQLQVPLDQPGNRTIESAVLSQNALLEQQKFAEERQNKAFAEPKHLGQNVKRPAGETVKHQTELMAKYREEASKRQANEMAVAAAKIQELQNRVITLVLHDMDYR